MTAGGPGNYEADTARLQSFIAETRALGDQIQKFANAFPDAVQGTHGFCGVPGTGDEYADKMRPQVDAQRDYVHNCLQQIAGAFTGITEGRFLELRNIKNTQGQNMDDIDQLRSRLGAPGTGGGKH
ncbi:hypothetical protein ACWF94_07465 [Streptomyces sp. NPDC055078]